MKTVFFFALFVCSTLLVAAQENVAEPKQSTLHFDLNYLSNSVYQGRKDSTTLPYLIPGIRYTAASGFYAAASALFLTTESRMDAASFETGYEMSKGNFYGGIMASTYVFNPQSVNVRAEASTSVGGYAGYDLSVVQPGISADIILGSGAPDYAASFNLGHRFATENERFSFTPTVYLNAGTQNYYNEYYGLRKFNSGSGKGRGRKKAATATSVAAQATGASSFAILDYELHGAFAYQVKQFSFSFEPQYAIPQSPSTVVVTTKAANGAISTITTKENISNSFYLTVGISYNLPLKKHK